MRKLSVLFTVCMIFGLNLCHSLKYDDAKLYPNGIGKPSGYCRRELDLTILVDESSSIQKQEWEKLIVFLKSLIRSINIAPNYAHLSLVTFSTSARWLISYLDPASKNESEALRIVDKLRESKPTIGFTYTGQALDFVRRGVLHFGARKSAPKAIILITDGESTQPGVTSQASAMLRDEGVTMLVVGVKSATSHECKSIVGCSIRKEECPAFFMTNWDDIIRKVGNLMTEVCETIPQDAVCKPIWSDWSPCNVKCGKGTKFRKLMHVVTIAEETVGTNGKSGKTCKEQFENAEQPQEECEGDCIKETSIAHPEPEQNEPGHEEQAPEEPSEEEDQPEPESPGEGDDEAEESPEEVPSEEEAPVEENPEELPSEEYTNPEEHVDPTDEETSHEGEEAEPSDHEETHDEEIHPEHEDEDYYDDSIEERPVVPAHSQKPQYKPLIDYTNHESTHESSHQEESTKKEDFKRTGAKIAGGVVIALLMLGAGGGYAYYRKKPKAVDVESGTEDNFDEATSLQHSQEGETYSVTDLDDGLWSESH